MADEVAAKYPAQLLPEAIESLRPPDCTHITQDDSRPPYMQRQDAAWPNKEKRIGSRVEGNKMLLSVNSVLPVPLLQHHQNPNHGTVITCMLIQMLPEQRIDKIGTYDVP